MDKSGIGTDREFKPSGSSTGWTVIGQGESGQMALLYYNPMVGIRSQPVAEGIPDQVILSTQGEAEILPDKIMVMDEAFWPPFDPIVARVEDGKVSELILPP